MCNSTEDTKNTSVETKVESVEKKTEITEIKAKNFLKSGEEIKKSDGSSFSNKLITHEDPIHLHKTLGILSLISFIYRYVICYFMYGHLNFNGTFFDWCSITLHLLLSSSSLIFHVIKRRILSRPMIIWEEYRLHAIIFTLRCWSVYAFGQLCPENIGIYKNVLLYITVMAHHLVVDEITRRFGKPNETTVRAKDLSRPITKTVLRGYSFYQFAAIGSHLVPHDRTSDMGFNTLIAIQSSAFLMTLYRKNIIRSKTHGYIYTACLILSAYHIFAKFPGFLFAFKLWAAFATRCTFGTNKYLIWAVFSFVSTEFFEKLFVETLVKYGIPTKTGLENTWFGAISGVLFLICVQYYVVQRAIAIQSKMAPRKTGRERANELQKLMKESNTETAPTSPENKKQN